MSPDRWQQIEEVFQAAVDLPIEDRENFLKMKCKEDFELRSEVEKLLADLNSAENFIERPVWTDSFFVDSAARRALSDSFESLGGNGDQDPFIGRRVGAYELIRELGHGGMGAVYLGRRADGEFHQQVAIKLIKRGMDSDFIIKRFRHERQILASFEHQFIARLLDGGTTPDGLPYFVMEFVEGDTLFDYCDRQNLRLRERLELFRQICSAVAYAHEKHVIHRDIKPGNILVTRTGAPKLLDFGIAKILDTDLIHESVSPTASIVRLMTPDYASPEQVRGMAVTPASDIYGLGVLLYELLSGHRPYNFTGKSLHEVSRVICEVCPEMPSRVIGTRENLLPKYLAAPEKLAATRRTSLTELKKEIRGDLDQIIIKALAKEVSDRYESVGEFSADIGRFLEGGEIRARSFVPHGRAPSADHLNLAMGRALAVLPFKMLSLSISEDTGDKFLGIGLADALITRLSKIRSFIVRPTSSVLAFEERNFDTVRVGHELKVDYILDGTIKRAGDRLRVSVQLLDVAKNATVWATSIDETIGDIFSLEDTISNRLVKALLPQITGSELTEFSKRGTTDAGAFEHYLRGRYYFNTSTEEGFAKSAVCFHKAIAEDPNYAAAYVGLADYYCFLGIYGVLPPQECFQAAIEMAEKAVELDDHLAEAHATYGFAVHGGNYDWSKAEFHLSRSLELNPNSATALAWFGIVRFTEGRFEEGLDFARRAIKFDHLTPFVHHNIGWGLYYARRFEESTAHYRQVVSDFPKYGLGYYGLNKSLRMQGRTAESLQAIGQAKKIFGETNFVRLAEAASLAADGDAASARKILGEIENLRPERFVSPYHRALVYAHLGDREEAFAALGEAVEIKDSWLNWVGVEPAFDLLREDDRFQKILEFTGYEVFLKTASGENHIFSDDRPTRDPGNMTTLFLENDESPNQLTAQTFSPQTRRFRPTPWIYIALGLIFLAGTGGFWRFFSNSEARPSGASAPLVNAQSIAILPFKTENPADENLGIGLADALSNRLGYIRRLSVIAPNSGRAVRDEPPGEIGKKLNAGYLLRGTLARRSGEMNVTAELIEPGTETTVWTEEFAGPDGDLFEIQTKIAEKIWISLGIEPRPMELQQLSRLYTKNSSAYDLYLIGRFQLTNRSPENIRKAINTFTRASQEDPGFALAYAGLADAHALLKLYEMPPPPDAYQKAREFARKAVELDEDLVEAHTSLAYIKFYGERDRPGSELEFRRAIQLNPSYSQAHHWFGLLLISLNRPAEAIDEFKTAAQLDPHSPITKTAMAMAYFYNRQYKEAIAECENVLTETKDFVPAYRILRAAYLMENNYEAARAAFQNELTFSGGEADDPGWYMIVAQVESLGGNRPEIIEKLNRSVKDPIIKNSPATFSYEIALAYNALGEKEKALAWLEKAEAERDNGFILLEVDPRLENLRHEPRFQALLAKLKKPE